MASFYDNLRQSNKLPKWGVIASPEESEQEFQDDMTWRTDSARRSREGREMAVKETAPLREAIKNSSAGKVIVDDSIYDEEELQRILNTVQKMGEYNNGVLFPGYTVISDSNSFNGERTAGQFHHGDNINMFGFAGLPDGLYGTKNNPYRIYIKNANETGWNDYASHANIKSGWHPKTGEKDMNAAHTHELSHSAHKEALKKSHPPTLWMSPEENEAYEKLISKFSTFRDLVQKLTDKYYLENTKNAAKSVSGYAESSHDKDSADTKFPFNEMFAEAYTDVLYNGDSAKPYSKALVEAYSEYLNEYNAIFDSEINRVRKQFNNSSFINNLRNNTPKFNNGKYIVK